MVAKVLAKNGLIKCKSMNLAEKGQIMSSVEWFIVAIGKNRRKVLDIIEEKMKKSTTIKCAGMQKRIELSDDGRYTWAFEVDTKTAEELKDKSFDLRLNFRVFVREDGDPLVREDHYIYGLGITLYKSTLWR